MVRTRRRSPAGEAGVQVSSRAAGSDPPLDRPVTEAAIEAAIFGLLAVRRDGATLCPSEVARALGSADGGWRELMPQVRQVAQRLARQDRLDVTRRGVPVDATSRGGPIRLGRPIGRDPE